MAGLVEDIASELTHVVPVSLVQELLEKHAADHPGWQALYQQTLGRTWVQKQLRWLQDPAGRNPFDDREEDGA